MKNSELEKFLFFESKECFDYKIDNVLVWKYLREDVYDQYMHKVYNTADRVTGFSKFKFGLFFLKELYKIFDDNDRVSPKDIVFLTFPRKTLINGQYCCTQLEPLINQVKDRCWILENPFWLEDKSYRVSHFSEKQKNMTYTDNIEILHRLRMPFLILFKRRKFRKKYYEKLASFCHDINRNLGIDINVDDIFQKVFWYVCFEKYAFMFYQKILKRLDPKCIVEVYTPNHQIALLNTVAHELKIPIIDVQHGAIGEYEPIMYSYYQKRPYAHLSNYIFVFGEYWRTKKNFHVFDEQIMPVGVPFLEEYAKNCLKCNKEKNTIVLISQARYSSLFYNLAAALQGNSEISSKNKILLKLHPYEYSLYKQGYYKNLEKQGVWVCAGLEKHLYSYFESAFCVIGINSTALYEALAFGIPIYIHNYKYGIENLVALSKTIPLIHIFDNEEKLIDEIMVSDNNSVERKNINYLFAEGSMQKTLEALGRICDVKIP